MSLEEIAERLRESLSDTLLSEQEKADLVSSILTGRPVLIIGPRGTAKEMVASRVLKALNTPSLPVNCSANLRREDLFGEVDPLALREFGYLDQRSYLPGILHKAHGGALLLKDLDNLPEKVADALASFIDDGIVELGQRRDRVETRIIALASSADIDGRLIDRFQVVQISYPENQQEEEEFISRQSSCRVPPPSYVFGIASNFLKRSRRHPDLESGASTRSGIRFVENVSATMELSGREPDEEDMYNSAYASFAHSIKLNPFSWKTSRELARNIFQDAVMATRFPKGPTKKGQPRQILQRYRIPIVAGLVIILVAVSAFMLIGNSRPFAFGPTPGTGNGSYRTIPFENESLPEDLINLDNGSIPEDLAQQLGIDGEDEMSMYYDPVGQQLLVNISNDWVAVPEYDEIVVNQTPVLDQINPPPEPRRFLGNISPSLLVLFFVTIVFLSTFLFDRLNIGKRIRDSKAMERVRRRLGISWEPLTRLYRNISEEVSPISQRLEGEALGETVKEISAARDELYAERAKDRASLADIAELVKKRPDRYPSLSNLLEESKNPDSTIPPENQLIKELEKHLVREGLIRGSRDVSFTHRVSKFLVSDVDERILRRVYDALQGVTYEDLPPLPSSDVKDVRKYQRGDSYKDIAIRESIRDAIRRGRPNVDRDNLFVYEREAEKREVVIQGDADIVVVLDLSGSMAYGDKLWYAKQAIVVMTIIAERYGNRVGVVGFRDLSTEVAELGADRNATIAKVANLLPRGGTNIAAGIRRSIDLLVGEVDVRKGERSDPSLQLERRKHMIVLTDGDATHPKPKQFAAEYARRVARLAARYGIVISVICIGDDERTVDGYHSYNPELATQLSEIGGGNLFFVKDMRDLSSVFVREIDKLMISIPMFPALVSKRS